MITRCLDKMNMSWSFRCSCALYLLVCMCLVPLTQAWIRASMYPEGPVFLLRGKPLSLNCTVETVEPGFSVDRLSIKLIEGSTGQSRDLANYSTYYQDEATVAVYIAETTLDDNGTYICYYEGELKRLKVVMIGEMPEPPSSIQCVSLNWIKMTCYVELSQKETYIPLNWTMEYRTSEDANWITMLTSECNKTVHACSWVAETGTFNRVGIYDIRVRVTNRLGEAVHMIRTVTPLNIVKPAPLRNFKWIKTGNSSVVRLTWKFPAQLAPYINMTYRLTVQAEKNWDDRTLFISTIVTSSNVDHLYSYTLQNLIPFANYSVSLSAKPVHAQGDWYWSDPVAVSLRTNSDIPGQSVSLVEGSYYAQNCGEYHICPVVYWKNPDKKYSHGKITGYQLSIFQIDSQAAGITSSKREPVSHNALPRKERGIMEIGKDDLRLKKKVNVTGRRGFDASDFKILKNESYLIEVKTGTEKGFSEAVSELVVPYWNEVEKLRPHRVIVELDETDQSAVVSWEMLHNLSCEAGLQEVVYWCTVDKSLGNQSYALCQDDFEWQVADNKDDCTNTTQKLDLPADKDLDNMKFGVSLDINGVSSGILWESCRFDDMYHAPDDPLYRVDPVKDEHTELQITVLYENCYSRKGGRPTSYEVFYTKFAGTPDDAVCPEGADVQPFPVDFDQPVMYLRILEIGTQYLVCMRAINRYHAGNYGKPKVVKTSAPEKANLTWLGITFGVIPAVIILFIITLCGIRYLRRRFRPVEISDIPVEIKDLEKNNERRVNTMETMENGNQGDSGLDNNISETTIANGGVGVAVSGFQNVEANDSSVPILAQLFSISDRNSKSPSSDRKRKISPTLPGYQSIQSIKNEEFDYEEYETSSLLENEDPGSGIDNDLNVEGLAAGIVPSAEHVYSDVEEQYEANLERDLAYEIEKRSESEMSSAEFERNSIDKTKEESPCTVSSEVTDSIGMLEYVEEDDMLKLSRKQIDNTPCSVSSAINISSTNVAEPRFENETNPYTTGENSIGKPLKVFMDSVESAHKNLDVNSGFNIGVTDKYQDDTKYPGKYLKQQTASSLADRMNDNHDKKKVNGLNGFTPHSLIDSRNGVENKILRVPQNSRVLLDTECSDALNKTNENTTTADAEKSSFDEDSLSDIDVDIEGMFSPSLGYGDSELSEILETLTYCKSSPNHSDFLENSPYSGYVDSDQVSIHSFASSNASSIQDRQSPEKKVIVQSSEHSSRAVSPLPEISEYTPGVGFSGTEIEQAGEVTETALKGNHETAESQIGQCMEEKFNKNTLKGLTMKEKVDDSVKKKAYEKCLVRRQKDIKTNIPTGNSSESGLSSYVTAGNIQKDLTQAECDRGSPDNLIMCNIAKSEEFTKVSDFKENIASDLNNTVKVNDSEAVIIEDNKTQWTYL